MKVGILTHYNVNNQGAQLQLAALHHYLQQLGHTPVVLTYKKNFDFNHVEQQKNSASISALPYYLRHYLLDKGLGLTLFNTWKVLTHRKAQKSYAFAPYDTNEVDAVVIGSDEVFSIDVGCNRMMYGYGLRAPAVAYAPAFGRTTIELLQQFGCRDLVAEGLQSLPFLSARDAHTRQMILALSGREVPLVCDPVLLDNCSSFRARIHPIKKPYLIVYAYDRNMNTPEEIRGIRDYARAHGLLTVSLGTYHAWCDRNIACNAQEWFTYFKDAACVVTDTFHGAVVAMKNHCNLAIFVRESINRFKLMSLMEETGLTARQLPDLSRDSLERVLSTPVCYKDTDARIARMSAESGAFLRDALESINES